MSLAEFSNVEGPANSMRFLALTGSPALRPGVVLNVMATPQVQGILPPGLTCGEVVQIRFGYCCPFMADGVVAAVEADHIVLMLADTRWMLKAAPVGSGIGIPGIVSSDWIVC